MILLTVLIEGLARRMRGSVMIYDGHGIWDAGFGIRVFRRRWDENDDTIAGFMLSLSVHFTPRRDCH